ncbi:MAG: hypothetical protein KKF42_04425 [Actinobacteria bacterium]|nr:hypothetical protein [Actinomycetota bacterium]
MALPTITNNSPSAGRIAWTGFSIQYDGVGHSIPSGNTDKRFVWWEYNAGTPIVQAADTLPDLAPADFLLFLNKGGIGLLVDATQVIDGSLIVAGSILADGIGANQIESWHVNANAITAGKIAAGAVTASTIDAGAITAEKLSIGAVGDNMVLNGSFEDGVQGFEVISSGAGAIADVVTGVSSSGANAMRLVRGTSANLTVGQDAAHYIPVTSVAGRSWYVACRAGAGVALASGFYLRVYWFQADKVTAASTASVDIAANVALTTAWSVFENAVTPPANARYMRVAVINALSGSTMYVDEITAHEVIVSAQIGSGQITAAKIASNTITANQIAANAVSVSELAANAVTAVKIAANAITADKIEATAIDGKTITGATVRTAASGQRVQLDTVGLRTFNASELETARLAADAGGLALTGSLVTTEGGNTQRATLSDGGLILDIPGSPGAGSASFGPAWLASSGDSRFVISKDSGQSGVGLDLRAGVSPGSIAQISIDGNVPGGAIFFGAASVKALGDTDWVIVMDAVGSAPRA